MARAEGLDVFMLYGFLRRFMEYVPVKILIYILKLYVSMNALLFVVRDSRTPQLTDSGWNSKSRRQVRDGEVQ